ncbi:128_t:CDS:2 [Gigaspora rosea]|nr:128_t:CDS:2 [Gigaspora rosea]
MKQHTKMVKYEQDQLTEINNTKSDNAEREAERVSYNETQNSISSAKTPKKAN